MSELSPSTVKQRVLWFGPILLLWTLIIVPSAFHAVWGSRDDGTTLIIAQAGLGASFNYYAGRVIPFAILHSWLIYQLGGVNPTVWYAVQSFEFLLMALLIYIAVGYLSNSWSSGALASAVMLTSAPMAENAYTISKAEPRVALFFFLTFLIVTFILRRVLFPMTVPLRTPLRLLWWLGLLLAIMLAVFSKESAIAIAAMGIVGTLVSFVQLPALYREKAVWTFFKISIISILVAVSLIFVRARVLKSVDYSYTAFTPDLHLILDNVAAYVRQSPDVFLVAFACLLFGVTRFWKTRRDQVGMQNERCDASAVMGWSSLATAFAYFSILLAWKFHFNYYMLPVAGCVSLSTGYFGASTGDRRKDPRLLRWAGGILLITTAATRFYSVPYIHFIATAQRGFDQIDDATARVGFKGDSKYHRIIDIENLYFAEPPVQRNLLYRALSAAPFSWVGGGELLWQYPEALKQQYGTTAPSPLEGSPPNAGDLFLVESSSYPFNIYLRGIVPPVVTIAAADQLIKRLEERTGLTLAEFQSWHSEWSVYQPWTLRRAKLQFRSVLLKCSGALTYRIDWDGRFGDGWIGKEAAVHITEDQNTLPGRLHFWTVGLPWALPIQVTLTGDKVQRIELNLSHPDVEVSIDKLLAARKGTIRMTASRTWVLKDFQPKSVETRALAVLVDYKPGGFNRK